MSSSPIEVPKTDWTGPVAEHAGDRSYSRKIGAIATIESAQGESNYSFWGTLSYRVPEAGDFFEVLQYEIRGVLIDGPDFGVIEFRARAPWRVELNGDRYFTIREPLVWRDQHNQAAKMDLVLRGSLLENDAIAYMSSTIGGALELGGAGEVHMTTPACW